MEQRGNLKGEGEWKGTKSLTPKAAHDWGTVKRLRGTEPQPLIFGKTRDPTSNVGASGFWGRVLKGGNANRVSSRDMVETTIGGTLGCRPNKH